MAINITSDTIVKILIRKGSDADRRATILSNAELGYATDASVKRLFVGDGTTAGGNPVGVKNFGPVNGRSSVTSQAYPGDIVFDLSDPQANLYTYTTSGTWYPTTPIFDNSSIKNTNGVWYVNTLQLSSYVSALSTTSIIVNPVGVGTSNVSPLTINGSTGLSLFNQITNTNNGVSASTDIALYNDSLVNYLDFGINSTGYNGNLYSPKFNVVNAGDSYVYATSGNLAHGAADVNGNLTFFTGGTLSANERLRVTNTGNVGIGTRTPTSLLTVAGQISSVDVGTTSLTSRFINLIHSPANDGTNPILFIGETDTTGPSGFNVSYDEITNKLTITSTFSGVSGAILTVDRYGNTGGTILPYTNTFTAFNSSFKATGVGTYYYPSSFSTSFSGLSGVIPAAEITGRMKEGKGRMYGSFLVQSLSTPQTKGFGLQFSSSAAFTSPVSILDLSDKMASKDKSYVRRLEGYVAGSNIVFPTNGATNSEGTSTSDLQTFPYGGDIYYRIGFQCVDNNVFIALSGGSISIIP
jgi:hypothetical protein